MPIKKHIRPGKIEASPSGDALVVNFTSEVTHLDEDGMPISVEKTLERREVPLGQAMRGLTTEDIRSLAREIVEKCRYIPESKLSQVEKVLNKIYALQTDVPFKDFGAGATKSSTNRTTGEDSVLPSQLDDLLPFASARNVDDYIEELYEEQMDRKVRGARKPLRICTEVPVLDEMAEHSTLLGVLSRELRENAKRSYELAVAITGIFLIFANFSRFHSALSKHQCGEVTMHILEYESKRRNVLEKEGGCRAFLDRQDHLLQICILVLRSMSEEVSLEIKFVKQKLCQMLPPLLSRQHEDLLLSTLSLLHKLAIFEQNKDQLILEMPCFVELLGHPATEVFNMALRLCYNLSFDARGRAALTESSVVPRLMHAVQHAGTRKVALKLLYHMTLDPQTRSAVIRSSPHLPSLAMQLARSKEQEPEAVALLVNLAADEAAACLLLAEDSFMAMALRAMKHKNARMLKVLRHIASHRASRPILLDVMGGDSDSSSYAWLIQLVQLVKATATDRHDILVEVLGILAALDCSEVPWTELCEAGLLETLPRLLMVGFAEDDVVLEAVMLLSILALDAAAVLANSKVVALLGDLLAAKSGDPDLLVQLLFLVQCLVVNDDTRDVVLDADVTFHIMELLRSSKVKETATACIDLLDLILAVESHSKTRRWTRQIQECKFWLHNQEWLVACSNPSQEEGSSSKPSPTNPGWGAEVDPREEKKSRRRRGR